MNVVLRADGGPTIGYGHLVRTSALAGQLLDRGHKITYATTTPECVQKICPTGVNTVTLPSRDDPEPAREFIRNWADVTIVDSYLADEEYQKRLWEVSPLVVVADDTRHQIVADVLVNGNLYASDLEYEAVGTEPKWCLGPEYLLLRRAIMEYAEQDPPWSETPTYAVVTMGGSDIAELTPTIIRAFDGIDIRADAIVGPGFSADQESEIAEAAEEVSADVSVVRDPDELPRRMFHADFAVTTASTTTYELLAVGTPTVCLPIVDNQLLIADALNERNAATVLERSATRDAFSDAIERYVSDPNLRRARRERGQELVDSEGCVRVRREVLSAAVSKQDP